MTTRLYRYLIIFVAMTLAWLILPAVAFAQSGDGISTGSQLADVTLTSIIVGSVLPNLIAVFVQPGWKSEVRGLVTFAICAAAGTVIAWLQGDLSSATDIGAAIVSVLVTSQVLYATLWKPSGIAPAIEQKSSLA
jgi:hypothetical protein